MRQVTKDEWMKFIKVGDFGLNLSMNFFAILQGLYHRRFGKSPHRASHAWFVKNPPLISEANGFYISGNKTFVKYIGDRTKSWVFRYKALNKYQLGDMLTYVQAAEETGGTYSIGGIWQFVKRFFGAKKLKDKKGVFCSEYTSRIILTTPIGYIREKKPHEITPSAQLSWFLSQQAEDFGWILAAHYDGKRFFISE